MKSMVVRAAQWNALPKEIGDAVNVVAYSCIPARWKAKGVGWEGQAWPGHFSNFARQCLKIEKKKRKKKI